MTVDNSRYAFWFSDLESSTRLWEEHPEAMKQALARHDEILATAITEAEGTVVKTTGDGVMAVFDRPENAVAAGLAAQQSFGESQWEETGPLRVRIGIHVGPAQARAGDYYGPAVNRAARIMSAGHGGQVLVSEATATLVRDTLPRRAGLLDLGKHRLKDLSRPEHLFQLTGDGLMDSFPALATLDAIPNNLPEQLTELIGRSAELAEIDRLLESTRLLTILAPGGTGKTRLAIQAAANHITSHPDGAFLISLADLTVGSDILGDVATTMGIALASGQDPMRQLAAYLAPRRVLLVFDNFEHLRDSAHVVTEILQAAPHVTAIVTSRERLAVPGETTLTLGGLTTTPDAAMESSAAELFIDAALRARPDLTLTEDDHPALARILDLTAGMPLAILLAAAWTNMLSLPDIADEIQKNLDFLEATAGDQSDRHRSIRAVFDYSWNLLTPDEQAAFSALSVFRGGFTRQAAEAVAGANLRDLANLVAKSLLTADPDAGRYEIHELLRQYAQTELERDPARDEAVRTAHVQYFGDLCQERYTSAFDDALGWLATMEADFDNVRLAWRESADTGLAGPILRMAGPIWYFTESRSQHITALDLFSVAVDSIDGTTDDEAALALATVTLGRGACLAILSRDVDDVVISARRAYDAVKEVADPPLVLLAGNLLGIALLAVRQMDELVQVNNECLALADRSDPSKWPNLRALWAGYTNVQGFLALMAGDVDTARTAIEASGRVFDEMGPSYILGFNLAHRAQLALADGRPTDAIDLFRRSVETSRSVGFSRGIEFASSLMAETLWESGDLEGAESALIEALDAAERTSMVPEMLKALRRIAAVRAVTDRQSNAVELLSAVLAEPDSHKQQWTEETATNVLAQAQLDELASRMDPNEYERAAAAGGAKPYRVAVKELTDRLPN